MQMHDVFSARAELKFVEGEPAGTIAGLGLVYGNIDSHRDLILKGACAESLAAHEAQGTLPKMYLNHSAFVGGSPLTVGVWTEMRDTDEGLRVKGRLYAVDHPEIALLRANLEAKQVDGLSIAFSVPQGGATFGRKSNEPRRTLSKINLVAVDIVGDPSNSRARIDSVKSASPVEIDAACEALVKMAYVLRAAQGSGSVEAIEQRSAMLDQLQATYIALKGEPMNLKYGFDTVREFEDWLHRDPEDGGKGFSNAKARELGNLVFKSAPPRDEASRLAEAADKEALADLGATLAGFTLPSF